MPPSASIAEPAAALRAARDPQLLRKLDRLCFTGQRSVSQRPGATPVGRASQASGLEFAAHRGYAPGDDLRHLDWYAYGRLEQRVMKTFRAEREAPVHLFIDASASMAFPVADAKLGFSIALAAALAYVALRQTNPVRAIVLGAGGRGTVSPLIRHLQRLPELHACLEHVRPLGGTRLAEGIDAYLRGTQLPGTAVVLSDFLVEPELAQRALERLLARGYDVVALRVLGAEERDPATLPRRVLLHDVESRGERLLDLTPAHRQRYAAALEAHLAELARWCSARAVRFGVADSSGELDACLFTELPRVGLLR
jgi:uncharacterized protein (DUF58 family)